MEKLDLLLKEVREVNNKIDIYLEEQAAEDNMDLEKTKLPNLDEIFGEGPVTDYVKANIDYLQAEDLATAREAEERMVAAAKVIEADQSNAYHVTIDEEAIKVTPYTSEEPKKAKLLSEFAEEVSEAIGVVKGYEGKYREDFNKGLIDAVHIIEERNGRVKFIVQTDSGNTTGHLSLSGDRVTIEVKDMTFTYDFHQEAEEEEENTHEHDVAPLDEWDEAQSEEGPLPCGCKSVKDCKFAVDVEHVPVNTPEEFVAVISDTMAAASAASMDIIEEYLLGVKELTRGQLDLVRHYLKQLPENSSNDIDKLSDRAVELAWKRISYKKYQ